MLKLIYSKQLFNNTELLKMQKDIKKYDRKLEQMSNKVDEMVGWMNIAERFSKKSIEDIKNTAKKLRKISDVLIVIGIGGSYLGARAIIEALKKSEFDPPKVIFVGNNMSEKYINSVIQYVKDKDFSINVISKSGTTTEPALAFRIFNEILHQKYSIDEVKKRIIVTTDKEMGALRQIGIKNEYKCFDIPENIGGRYSVLTPVGLLPMAFCDIDIDELIKGAGYATNKYLDENVLENDAYKYALIRHLLYYKLNKKIEVLVSYEPCMHYFIEWIRQLFAESEGKDLKGIFPVGAIYSTDLHSIGQYIQEGERHLFETTIGIKDMLVKHIEIPFSEDNLDNFNTLSKRNIEYVNNTIRKATIEAHVNGNVPPIEIIIDKLNEENLGELIYFFEKACAMYCLLNDVNPFNQPGVEMYKNNMFRIFKEDNMKKNKK